MCVQTTAVFTGEERLSYEIETNKNNTINNDTKKQKKSASSIEHGCNYVYDFERTPEPVVSDGDPT